jgi:hypothetical protein
VVVVVVGDDAVVGAVVGAVAPEPPHPPLAILLASVDEVRRPRYEAKVKCR